MEARTHSQYAARARVVKAMAHPTRLFVVDELSQHGQKCVCELTAMIGADMSTVSRHLAILKSAGIISDEKRGAQVFYHLTMDCVLKFVKCVDSLACKTARDQERLFRN
ncbi:MAG: ArsR/SmtB family transcription factor [Thermoguttaceae bacterium]|jgi:DNA-binding transcriptional ArsR family regulator